MTAYDHELDTSGTSCPIPLLRVKKTLKSMSSGQTLRVTTTDPGSINDFAAFARQSGHTLLESVQENGRFLFLFKKS